MAINLREFGLETLADLDRGLPTNRIAEAWCRFCAPTGATTLSKRPLLIWLHDAGGSEAHIEAFIPYIGQEHFTAVGLRGPIVQEDDVAFDWDLSDTSVVETLIDDCIELAAAEQVADVQSIFLGGNGVGGTMAAQIALHSPARYRGLITLGGQLTREAKQQGAIHGDKTPPLLVIQGRDSQRFSTEEFTELVRFLFAARFTAELRQYPCGDEVMTGQLADIGRWINAVHAPQTTPTPQAVVSVCHGATANLEPVLQS